MRRLIAFGLTGDTLLGTLDDAGGRTGLLIVSGGNEVRAGAHRGMAMLAQRLAASGVPVFRFDRRGIGDSTGENAGYAGSRDDIAAAVATFRADAGVERIVGFGNCDAATALAYFHRDAGIDALVLANPWIVPRRDDLPPPAAIRQRYIDRLRDPRTVLRAMRGGVDFGKAIRGLARVSRKSRKNEVADRFAAALAAADTPISIVIAERDATALAFLDAWRGERLERLRERCPLTVIATDSHSFAHEGDAATLEAAIRAAL